MAGVSRTRQSASGVLQPSRAPLSGLQKLIGAACPVSLLGWTAESVPADVLRASGGRALLPEYTWCIFDICLARLSVRLRELWQIGQIAFSRSSEPLCVTWCRRRSLGKPNRLLQPAKRHACRAGLSLRRAYGTGVLFCRFLGTKSLIACETPIAPGLQAFSSAFLEQKSLGGSGKSTEKRRESVVGSDEHSHPCLLVRHCRCDGPARRVVGGSRPWAVVSSGCA